jgi:hypothetical protein
MDLHPIEAAWRRFRNGPHADLLRKSPEARSSYLRFIHMARLPGAVTWNLVALGEAPARQSAPRLAAGQHQRTNRPPLRSARNSRGRSSAGEFEHARDAGRPDRAIRAANMRRAHSHLYWDGRQRSVPRVRFLLPISVEGGLEVVEEPRAAGRG